MKGARLVFAGALMAALTGCWDRFDAETWRSEAGNWQGENARAGMVGAVRDRITPGTPRDDVRALLGAPDSSEPDADLYVLGRAQYGVDFEMLEVSYDARAHVVALTLRRS